MVKNKSLFSSSQSDRKCNQNANAVKNVNSNGLSYTFDKDIGICCKNTMLIATQRIYQKMQNIRNTVSNLHFNTTKKQATNQ